MARQSFRVRGPRGGWTTCPMLSDEPATQSAVAYTQRSKGRSSSGGRTMAVQQGSQTEALRAKRDRYVARGVSIAPIFAAHAHGARLTDVDGTEYIDFAGGIGVLNLGHTPEAVVAAIREQSE